MFNLFWISGGITGSWDRCMFNQRRCWRRVFPSGSRQQFVRGLVEWHIGTEFHKDYSSTGKYKAWEKKILNEYIWKPKLMDSVTNRAWNPIDWNGVKNKARTKWPPYVCCMLSDASCVNTRKGWLGGESKFCFVCEDKRKWADGLLCISQAGAGSQATSGELDRKHGCWYMNLHPYGILKGSR